MKSHPHSVVVLSDIHANARALKAALAQARQGPCDQIIVLGDLLTYGRDVDEVLDLVSAAESNDGATIILGNHDELYFNLAGTGSSKYDSLPDWVRESVDWTTERVDGRALQSLFLWLDEITIDRWLFAHADPFRKREWRYLKGAKDCCEAASVLQASDLRGIVVGHVHRPRLALVSEDCKRIEQQSTELLSVAAERLERGSAVVAVSGAVGQPRGSGLSAAASLLRIRMGPSGVKLRCEAVQYDVAAHMSALNSMRVTPPTRERLLSFFSGYSHSE